MITEREIFLTDPEEKQKVIDFLKEFDLTFTGNMIIRWDFLMITV